MHKRTETEDWLIDYFQANSLKLLFKTKSAELKHFSASLYPFAENFFSPLNPIFSFQVDGSDTLAKRKVWLFRDGAVPLSWFYRNTPKAPVGVKCLVHSSLASLIPDAWRASTKLYDFYTADTFDAARPPKTILLSAPVNPAVMNLDELDARLASVCKIFSKAALKKIKIKVFCPIPSTSFVLYEDAGFEFQVFQKICSYFGPRVEFVRWPDIEHGTSFKGTAYVELNAGWLFKGSFVNHLALSRGAGLLSIDASEKSAEAKNDFPLSPFHGVRTFPCPTGARGLSREEAEKARTFYMGLSTMIDGKNTMFWPKWYQGWTRAWLNFSSDMKD